MNKDRLEEIEEHILKIDEDDSTNRSKMLDYRHWTYELLKIASEQAERVQELEYLLDLVRKRKSNLEKQNKRYREALEALSDLVHIEKCLDEEVIQVACKALEDEE